MSQSQVPSGLVTCHTHSPLVVVVPMVVGQHVPPSPRRPAPIRGRGVRSVGGGCCCLALSGVPHDVEQREDRERLWGVCGRVWGGVCGIRMRTDCQGIVGIVPTQSMPCPAAVVPVPVPVRTWSAQRP
jgi:hypothetical protein